MVHQVFDPFRSRKLTAPRSTVICPPQRIVDLSSITVCTNKNQKQKCHGNFPGICQPFGNQTWNAWKSHIYFDVFFRSKPPFPLGISSCHVWFSHGMCCSCFCYFCINMINMFASSKDFKTWNLIEITKNHVPRRYVASSPRKQISERMVFMGVPLAIWNCHGPK